MTQTSLYWPMLIQIAMTTAILFWLAYSRVSRIAKQGLAEIRKTGFPTHVNNTSAEVLEDIIERKTPATMALRDWGKKHRFAGSKDRSAIGNYVHDALRCKSSLCFRMDSETPRSIAIASAVFMGGHSSEELAEAFKGDDHAPETLSDDEIKRLNGSVKLDSAPAWVQSDVPEWIWPMFETNFDEEAISEGKALR